MNYQLKKEKNHYPHVSQFYKVEKGHALISFKIRGFYPELSWLWSTTKFPKYIHTSIQPLLSGLDHFWPFITWESDSEISNHIIVNTRVKLITLMFIFQTTCDTMEMSWSLKLTSRETDHSFYITTLSMNSILKWRTPRNCLALTNIKLDKKLILIRLILIGKK